MRGNIVPAWRFGFTGKKLVLPKMKRLRWSPSKMTRLKVQRADGSESVFPLGAGCACFDVGEKRKLKMAAGDKLLLQANWRKKFINGELVEVRAIQGDSVVLADGRVIPENYRTFTHGYAVTSHAAQGKTVDEVLVVASSRSLPADQSAAILRQHLARARSAAACSLMMPRCCARTSPVPARGWRRWKWSRPSTAENSS